MAQCFDDFRHRIKPTLAQSSKNGHEYGLRLGTEFALVAKDILAHDDCWANFSFGVIVI